MESAASHKSNFKQLKMLAPDFRSMTTYKKSIQSSVTPSSTHKLGSLTKFRSSSRTAGVFPESSQNLRSRNSNGFPLRNSAAQDYFASYI